MTLSIPNQKRLFKLAIHHRDYQNDENRYDRNRYDPICSHPIQQSVHSSLIRMGYNGSKLPTSHPPQCLHTPIHIPLTLQHRLPRMLNRLPLQLQIRQRPPPNILCLIRNPLTFP